ncbi:unnamed protein product [Darwinula stevensoni]|uniref:Uncharacterized protein n=1 Tax=Darwinula stevensoni TaxID=69355 RepID=A0A7R8XA06_9CRUS|nr:unnamed protein product [Darwinula stevensoni]CAG0889748.1 unnamed protein product [Darwinula stevensoni]
MVQCLWNVFGSSPASTIEILLTPEDFGNFSNRSLLLRIGYGYKDDNPAGNEETVLATFDYPVPENTMVIVEGGEAWVDMLARQEIGPFRIFSTIKNEAYFLTEKILGGLGNDCKKDNECNGYGNLKCDNEIRDVM